MKESVKCSRCGDKSHLNLVTIRYAEDSEPGRLLVYCRQCRNDFSKHINVDISLDEITPENFIDLYRTNKTSSDPITAAEIAFGIADAEVVNTAQMYIDSFNLAT